MNIRYFIKKLLFYLRDSRGINLVEVVIALSICSVVTAGATTTINQIFILVPRAENNMLAMRQAQSAGAWLSRDATCAQAITPTPDQFTLSTSTPLVISYVNWDATKTTITYSVGDDHKLQRQVLVVNEITGSTISDSQMPVADNIASIIAKYDYPPENDEKKILMLTITAQLGSEGVSSASVTRVYNISPRSF